jgi:hypothetical protein
MVGTLLLGGPLQQHLPQGKLCSFTSLPGPLAACAARSSRSTSSSLSTACFPCLRIHRANLGSDSSMASANSLRLHCVRWNGQYACRNWRGVCQV